MAEVLKVLHVAETVKGGVASYLNLLERQAAEMHCEFYFLAPASQRDQLDVVHLLTHRHRRSLTGVLGLARAILHAVEETGASVVYAHSTFAGLALCLATVRLDRRIRTLYCPHGWASLRKSRSWVSYCVRTVERAISHVPSGVVNISRFEHAYSRSMGFSPRCVLIENTVLPSGPAVTQSPLFDPAVINVLFVGRFDRQKGFDILCDAMRYLNRQAPGRFCFHLVGDVVLRDHQQDFAFAKNIHYHGWAAADEIDFYYRNADFLVVPSRWEGFGLCVLEAFRNGLPVIASRSGALPDLVEHERTGLLFDGTAEHLCEQLCAVTREDKLRWGERCLQAYSQRFALERFVGAYRALLHPLASEPQA